MSTSTNKTNTGKILTIVGLSIMILLVLTKIMPTSQFAQYSLFVGLAFFFIVEGVSKTPNAESGLRFNTILKDIKKPIVIILTLLPIGTAIGSIVLGNALFGDQYVNHVLGRTDSIFSFDKIILFIAQMIVAAFGEEIAFRGFFVGKGSKIAPFWVCAIVSSAVFAAAHIAVGNVGVVVYDIVGIFIDGLIYAMIFKKTNNCLISTIAHLLCNAAGYAFVFIFL